jgi:hypothetical protein
MDARKSDLHLPNRTLDRSTCNSLRSRRFAGPCESWTAAAETGTYQGPLNNLVPSAKDIEYPHELH